MSGKVIICVNKNIKKKQGDKYVYQSLLTAIDSSTGFPDSNFWVLGGDLTPVKGYTATLVKVKYDKKIYSPGEVVLTFTCALGGGQSSMSLSGELKKQYLNNTEPFFIDVVGFKGDAKVSSSTTAAEKVDIARNYYVYGISVGLNPERMSDQTSCQYTLRCFSPDKKLTLDKYSDTYVGRCLSTDICTAVKDNDHKLPGVLPTVFSSLEKQLGLDKQNVHLYDCASSRLLFLGYSSGTNGVLAHRQKNLLKDTAGKVIGISQHGFELKQPYLVQYNESFYDFLSRTLHRCGEFLYFEKGKLCIGLPSETLKKLDKIDTENATGALNYGAIPYCEYPEISLSDESVQEVRTFSNDCTDPRVSDSSFNSVEKYEVTYRKEVKEKGPDGKEILEDGKPKTKWIDAKEVIEEVNYKPYHANMSSDEFFHGVTEEDASVDSYKMWIVYTFLDTFFKSDSFLMGLVSAFYGLLINLIFVNAVLTKGVKKKLKEKYVYDPKNDPKKNVPCFTYDVGLTDNICNDFYRQVERWEEISGKNKVKMSFFTNLPQMYLADAIYLKDGIWNNYVIIGMSGEYTTGSSSHSAEAVPVIKDNLPLYMGKETEIETGKETEVEQNILIDKKTGKFIKIATEETTATEKTEIVKAKVKKRERVKVKGTGVQGVVLPPPGIPHTLRSSAMEAVVTDNDDPLRIGRVRVKYLWQTDPTPSPWVRVTVPFTGSADMDSGFLMTPDKGEHVMLDYIGGNIEQPYVNGSVYYAGNRPTIGDKAPEHPQYWPSKRIRTIASSNGHNLTFADGNSFSFLEVLVPPLKTIASIVDRAKGDESKFKKTGSAGSAIAEKEKNFELKGGKIVLGDGSALCSIGIYPGERKVAINSSFGSVQVSAFTGISLSSPNGDINISAKNINIKAGNNITIQSGTNIDRSKDSIESMVGTALTKTFVTSGIGLIKKHTGVDFEKCLDFTFLRCVMDSILRPVEGTLSLRSNRNTILTAGAGDVTIPNNYLAKTHKTRLLKEKETPDKWIFGVFDKPLFKEEAYATYIKDDYFKDLNDVLTTTASAVDDYIKTLSRNLSTIKEKLTGITKLMSEASLAESKKSGDFIKNDEFYNELKKTEDVSLDKDKGVLTNENLDGWFLKVGNEDKMYNMQLAYKKRLALYINAIKPTIQNLKVDDSEHNSLKGLKTKLKGLVANDGLLSSNSLTDASFFDKLPNYNVLSEPELVCFLNKNKTIKDVITNIDKIIEDLSASDRIKKVKRLVLCYVIYEVWKMDKSRITISKVKENNGVYSKGEEYKSTTELEFSSLTGNSLTSDIIEKSEAWQCFVDGISKSIIDIEDKESVKFLNTNVIKPAFGGNFIGDAQQVVNWRGVSGPRAFFPSSGDGGGNLFISNDGGHLTMLNDEGTGWKSESNVSVKAIKNYLKNI